MERCDSCGAPVSTRDTRCSYCGVQNARHRAMEVRGTTLLAQGVQAFVGGQHAAAIETLSTLVGEEPDAFDAYFYLCAAWNALGHLQQAADAMRRAIVVRGGSAAAHYNLGDILLRQNRHDEARAVLEQARRLVATDPSTADRATLAATIEARLASAGGTGAPGA